jgi:transcriptional regulator with XRE-family HTH domain
MKKTLNQYLQALPPSRRKKVDRRAEELIAEEMGLQQLRKAMQQSQQLLAEKLHVKQAEVSKIERRTDMFVSTLRDFIQAMGGTLEITASFPNHHPVKITQFEALEDDVREAVKTK